MDLENIGIRIKQCRRELDLTQTEMAHKLGLASYQSVQKWENGTTIPSLDQFVELCDLFQCDSGYLLGEYDTKTRQASDIVAETGLSAAAAEELRSIHARNQRLNLPIASQTDILSGILEDEKAGDLLSLMGQYIGHLNAEPKSKGSLEEDLYTLIELTGLSQRLAAEGQTIIPRTYLARFEFDHITETLKAILGRMAEQARADSQKQKKPLASSGQGQEGV